MLFWHMTFKFVISCDVMDNIIALLLYNKVAIKLILYAKHAAFGNLKFYTRFKLCKGIYNNEIELCKINTLEFRNLQKIFTCGLI